MFGLQNTEDGRLNLKEEFHRKYMTNVWLDFDALFA